MAKNTATARRRRGASVRTRPRRSDAARQKYVGALQQAVETAVGRLQSQRLLRPGTIVFRAAEGETPIFALRSSEHGAMVEQSAGDTAPLLEVIGDPRRISAIV